jgi:plasmid stability protein
MPTLTIKNIPEDLYECLKKSAAGHHRSINGEVIHTLENLLMKQRVDPGETLERIDALRSRLPITPITDAFLRKAKNEGRS